MIRAWIETSGAGACRLARGGTGHGRHSASRGASHRLHQLSALHAGRGAAAGGDRHRVLGTGAHPQRAAGRASRFLSGQPHAAARGRAAGVAVGRLQGTGARPAGNQRREPDRHAARQPALRGALPRDRAAHGAPGIRSGRAHDRGRPADPRPRQLLVLAAGLRADARRRPARPGSGGADREPAARLARGDYRTGLRAARYRRHRHRVRGLCRASRQAAGGLGGAGTTAFATWRLLGESRADGNGPALRADRLGRSARPVRRADRTADILFRAPGKRPARAARGGSRLASRRGGRSGAIRGGPIPGEGPVNRAHGHLPERTTKQ